MSVRLIAFRFRATTSSKPFHAPQDRANFFSTSRANKLAPIGKASSLKL
jgi:hypothetical protein